jgi:hypothetical protein
MQLAHIINMLQKKKKHTKERILNRAKWKAGIIILEERWKMRWNEIHTLVLYRTSFIVVFFFNIYLLDEMYVTSLLFFPSPRKKKFQKKKHTGFDYLAPKKEEKRKKNCSCVCLWIIFVREREFFPSLLGVSRHRHKRHTHAQGEEIIIKLLAEIKCIIINMSRKM